MDGLHSAADKPVRDRVAGERAVPDSQIADIVDASRTGSLNDPVTHSLPKGEFASVDKGRLRTGQQHCTRRLQIPAERERLGKGTPLHGDVCCFRDDWRLKPGVGEMNS